MKIDGGATASKRTDETVWSLHCNINSISGDFPLDFVDVGLQRAAGMSEFSGGKVLPLAPARIAPPGIFGPLP